MPRVRCVHNVAKGPNVNIIVDGNIVLKDVAYKVASGYLDLGSGIHKLAIATKNGNVLASQEVFLERGMDYTVIAHGDISNLSSVALLTLKDNNSCPLPLKSKIRFVHAAANVPAVDIWVNDGLKLFENVSYGNVGKPSYWAILSATVKISVRPAGSFDTVLEIPNFKMSPQKIYTVIATGLLNDKEAPLSVIVAENVCH